MVDTDTQVMHVAVTATHNLADAEADIVSMVDALLHTIPNSVYPTAFPLCFLQHSHTCQNAYN